MKKLKEWFGIRIKIRNVEKVEIVIGPGIILFLLIGVGFLFDYIWL